MIISRLTVHKDQTASKFALSWKAKCGTKSFKGASLTNSTVTVPHWSSLGQGAVSIY